MKAIVQGGYGTPQQVLELEEVDRPSVGDDEVLIRVRATSVNTPDWITVAGVPYILRLKSGLRRPTKAVRGSDVAGVVEAVGRKCDRIRAGDEVFGSAWAGTLATEGTFAEFTVVSGVPAHQEARRAHLRGSRSIGHVGNHRDDRHARRGQGRTGYPRSDQRRFRRRRNVCGADREGTWCRGHGS